MQPVGKWLIAALVVAFAVTKCFGANEIDFEEDQDNAPIVAEENGFAGMANRNEENKLEEELLLATEKVRKEDLTAAEAPDEPEGDTSFEDTAQDEENQEEATMGDGDPSKEPDQTSETYADYLQQEPLMYEEEEEAATENDAEEDEGESSGILDDTGELQYSAADNDEFIEEFGEDNTTTTTHEPTAQVMREPLVGVGYHVINGNPDGSFLDGGRDPGLLRTRRIMRLTFTDGKSTNLRGTRQRVADQVKFVRADSCSTSQQTKMIYGVSSYRSKLSSSVSASYRSGYSSWYSWWWRWYSYYSYSRSSGYSSVRAQTTVSRKVFMDKTSHCHVGVARYMMESVPHSNKFGVSRSFYHAFLNLPETGNLSSYHHFMDQWGTHIVVKATLGGRRIDRYRASVDQLYSYAETKSRSSVHVGSSHGGYGYYYYGYRYSNYLSMNTRSFNRKVTSKTQIGKSFTQLAIGSHIDYNKKQHRWQIPIKDTNIPEATKIEIIPISSVCDHVGYWTCIPEAKLTNVQIQNLLRKRCVNLMKAAKTYAKHLKLKKEKDPSLNLPLVWPEGTYGLPKAKSGCPKGQGFDFISGWRRHDTENYRTSNIHSSPIHLDGHFGQNIRHSFCTKRTAKANRKYRRKQWPRGNYCLYKKGNCPVGFKQGYIYWDDENSRNSNSKKGTLPDGRYNRNTLIRFCCRHDGSSRDPIALPTSTPFYLLRYGGRCQKVLGMKVTDEFVRWDDENYRNADSHGGSYPDDKFPNHMLHFCYYHK